MVPNGTPPRPSARLFEDLFLGRTSDEVLEEISHGIEALLENAERLILWKRLASPH